MPQWLKPVPGFRSETPWKQVLAVVGYIVIFALLLRGNAPVKLLALSVLAGVLLATNGWGLRNRVPLFNSTKRLTAASAWVGLGLVGLVALVVALPNPESSRSAGSAVSSQDAAIVAIPVSEAETLAAPSGANVAVAQDVPAAAIDDRPVVAPTDMPPTPLPTPDPQAIRIAQAQEHVDAVVDFQTAGQYGLALESLRQALAIQSNYAPASSLQNQVRTEATAQVQQARAQATAEAQAAAARRFIPGLAAVDVTGNFRNRGFSCPAMRIGATGGGLWDCTLRRGDVEHQVSVTGRFPTQIQFVSMTTFQYGANPSDSVAAESSWFLSHAAV